MYLGYSDLISMYIIYSVINVSMYDYLYCNTNRPYSSMLGKAQGTEIFRNMENFQKVSEHAINFTTIVCETMLESCEDYALV